MRRCHASPLVGQCMLQAPAEARGPTALEPGCFLGPVMGTLLLSTVSSELIGICFMYQNKLFLMFLMYLIEHQQTGLTRSGSNPGLPLSAPIPPENFHGGARPLGESGGSKGGKMIITGRAYRLITSEARRDAGPWFAWECWP